MSMTLHINVILLKKVHNLKFLLIFGIVVLLLFVGLSGCIDSEISESILQFSITKFEVKPNIINQGEPANLSWVVVGAISVSIDNGIENVSLVGERIIAPTENTTYTLTAKNSTAILTATTQIIVTESTETNGEKSDNITNNPPTSSISASPRSGEAPLTVQFVGLGADTDGTISSYHWDFDDGTTSNEQNPTHTFASEGTYNITLTVTDNEGEIGTDSVRINTSPHIYGWYYVKSFSGKENTTTDTFTTSGIRFRMDWSITSSSEEPYFEVRTRDISTPPYISTGLIICDYAPASGMEYINQSANSFYSDIIATNLDNWLIKIYEWR